MDQADAALIGRVRVLVLQAMLEAGYQPSVRQIKRALRPVRGELVPVEVDGRGGLAVQAAADGR